jgi:hypothetical protein
LAGHKHSAINLAFAKSITGSLAFTKSVTCTGNCAEHFACAKHVAGGCTCAKSKPLDFARVKSNNLACAKYISHYESKTRSASGNSAQSKYSCVCAGRPKNMAYS